MYVLHNKEQKKIVCFVWGEKGRDVSPQGRSKWLFEVKEKSGNSARKADRSRMIKKGKQSPLKERNERTGAFSPCGYSTFMTTDRNKTSSIHQESSVSEQQTWSWLPFALQAEAALVSNM